MTREDAIRQLEGAPNGVEGIAALRGLVDRLHQRVADQEREAPSWQGDLAALLLADLESAVGPDVCGGAVWRAIRRGPDALVGFREELKEACRRRARADRDRQRVEAEHALLASVERCVDLAEAVFKATRAQP